MSFRLPNPTLFVLAALVLAVVVAVAQQHRGQPPSPQVVSAAQSTTPAPPPGTPTATEVFQRAVALLQSHQSLSARVALSSDIFGRRPLGSGIYHEQRIPGVTLFRLEMRLQLDGQPSGLLQVCDGHHIWIYRQILQQDSLVRIDLDRVNHALGEAGRWQPGNMGGLPAIGGLPRLLQGIGSNFNLARVDRFLLRGQIPAWRLEGLWTTARLAQLLPDQAKAIQAGKAPNLFKLPKHLPERVLVFFGMDDLFPYRIEYCRRPDKKESSDVAADKIVTQIDFYEPAFDAPIPPGRFDYMPGNLPSTDETDKFLAALGVGKK
jgi:hypothetical protein